MTDDTTIESEARAIIETAVASAGATQLDGDGRFHAFVVPAGGDVLTVDTEKLTADVEAQLEQYRDTPRRKAGTYSVRDVPSFCAYMSKHSDIDTEVWADQRGGKVTAVIDANSESAGPRWADHRLEYPALKTVEWLAWEKLDGQMIPQEPFAEHIEDRLSDILEPSAAEMLELAQHFYATVGVKFESSTRLGDGQRQLNYKETIDATVGKAGDIKIPEKFYIALRPYEGSEPFRVECRFRYRMGGGQLALGFKIVRPEDILRDAFDTLVAKINQGLDEESVTLRVPVLLGTAPAAVRR